ncbi:hypothetical protein Ab1vBOLIVR4_gp33 [Agrobacterium phage OLIVR4]|nr:hypothetical protein Ab1vBOLIVR4_gp33 [Agrobacterium phage OLIVR4]
MNDLVLIQLQEMGCVVEPCGSRVTCNPPPTDTDRDYLVEVKRYADFEQAVEIIMENGFHPEGSDHYRNSDFDFQSWRFGEINLIVTYKDWFATRHRAATTVCKSLKLMDKADRIALFQKILYGVSPDSKDKDIPY